MKEPVGSWEQFVQPKLRMICGGDVEVNTRRAETSAAVQVAPEVAERFERLRTAAHAAAAKAVAPVPAEAVEEPEAVERPPRDVFVSAFVELASGRVPDELGPLAALESPVRRGSLVTGRIALDRIGELAQDPAVAYVSVGETLAAPTPVVTPRRATGPAPRSDDPARGAGVLVGIVDVGGFDFAHPEFLDDEGATRFEAIWDQGAEPDDPEDVARPYGYGRVISKERMTAALAWNATAPPERRAPATDLEAQSSQVPGSHGTHVAGIAAGRHGVAPGARLAGVLLALSDEDRDHRRSFYDSSRLAHAVDWLFALGARLGMPVVVNVSLGTNGHAHDGSSPVSRWIDAALTVPGRCVCVAAGNAGQEAPRFPGDVGHFMGRIHTGGRIPASGLEADVEWVVPGDGAVDGSENELEVWYEAQDVFAVEVHAPTGERIEAVSAGSYVENRELANGTFVSVYNERYHPANGANRISVFLSPRLKGESVGVQSGTWIVRLRGVEVRDGRYDAWIERDDPRPVGRGEGEEVVWTLPSFFSGRSNVDRSSVSSLACGHRILSVANLDAARESIHPSSSQGPTRDGRYKPEIAAPGTDVLSARGFSSARRPWVAMTGTSMASPYVAGVAAAMLAVESRLTAAQVIGIVRRTARPLPGTDYRWQDGAGFGRIRPGKCLEEAARAFDQVEVPAAEVRP